MIIGRVGQIVYDHFSVVDENNELVPLIPSQDFTITIFDPFGIEVGGGIVNELGDGHYRVGIVPDNSGLWYLTVYHSVYFPWGKSDEIMVYKSDVDQIAEGVLRVLGLTQENYYLDNTSYVDHQGAKLLTSGRMRIYSNHLSVGTDEDVLATYSITSTWNGNELETYKVVRQ